MDIHYFILLQIHYYFITTCYCHITTLLLPHYCFIITWLLDMNVHFFKLLQGHYFIITLYYFHVTTHYFLIITVLLLDYCKGTFHYFIIITYLLLLHYDFITTILLPDYYRITTIDCFIIPWSILWLITTWLLQLLPLLPIFITTLIPITTIITIIHLPNLEMQMLYLIPKIGPKLVLKAWMALQELQLLRGQFRGTEEALELDRQHLHVCGSRQARLAEQATTRHL